MTRRRPIGSGKRSIRSKRARSICFAGACSISALAPAFIPSNCAPGTLGHNAEAADLYEFDGGPFDTIICLCNGLDKVGRLADLPRFLERMRQLLAPNCQFIADSFDLLVGASAARHADLSQKEAAGRYFGELDLRFEYKGRSGAPFSVLQIDHETLARIAGHSGWACELIASIGGHYLARARPS